jgi:sugar O-acyltransferase (sialic acid O-acetyltransferase NeuD family)
MSSSKDAVAIVGFHDGSAGQVESWFEQATGLRIACFVVDSANYSEVDIEEENKKRTCKTTAFPQRGLFKGHPVIVSTNWIEQISSLGVKKVLSLEPVNQRRRNQIELVKDSDLQLVSAIHPSALILPNARIEDGVWINAGCIIGYKAEIGAGAIINTGVQIDHHNVLRECCQVDPGVVTAGNVVLGECCHIHTGAVLINRVEIGADSIIGAGAVVLKNVPARCTAVGVPARIIRSSDGLPTQDPAPINL